jgi:DNA-binding response OmpR family regulator
LALSCFVAALRRAGHDRPPAGRQPTPIVAVLADTDAVYLRHGAEAEGADAYFVKPAHLANLDDRLAALFGSGPAAA